MAPARAWKDEYTLLCERCGYVIEGLPGDGGCPECGKPIAESLPERRTGTAWQVRPRLNQLPRTWWRSLRHPLRTLDQMRPRSKRDARLGLCSVFAGGLLMGCGWWDPLLWIYTRPLPNEQLDAWRRLTSALIAIGFGVVTAVLLAGVMWTLTRVETKGLGVIARTRGFRMSREFRCAITAHGCAGWVLAGAMFFVLCSLSNWILDMAREPDWLWPSSGQGTAIWMRGSTRLPWWAHEAVWHARWAGLLIGFLWFETFAWLGLRRLRYANTQRPTPTGSGSA